MNAQSATDQNGNGTPSWLARLNKVFSGEPQDRDQLIDLLRDAERRNLVDAQALAMIEGIKDGTGHPFAGPIHDQSGKLRVPKGKHMTNAELATMNWYVQDIKGSIPK